MSAPVNTTLPRSISGYYQDQLSQRSSVVDGESSGGGGGVGGAIVLPSKDMAISNFNIQFDGSDTVKAGDEISGKVMMDVWGSMNIRYVEFLIVGTGTVTVFKDTSTFLEKPRNETYIHKSIFLIGPEEGEFFVTLNRGRYVSDFRYQLPELLPPSVTQEDLSHGYVFKISYYVQARVCDRVQGRSGIVAPHLARIIKAAKRKFTIIPSESWTSIPGAQDPIIHTDKVLLSCSSLGEEPTSVGVTMERSVYPVGDDITVNVEVRSTGHSRVNSIKAELEQRMTFDTDMIRKCTRKMVTAKDNLRDKKSSKKKQKSTYQDNNNDDGTVNKTRFELSVPKTLVPSFLPGCNMVTISYTVKLSVHFSRLGGRLVICVPVVIAPFSESEPEPITPLKDSTDSGLPVFTRALFSKSPFSNGTATNANGNGQESANGSIRRSNSSNGHQYDRGVTTKYITCFRCFSCCCCGIYE